VRWQASLRARHRFDGVDDAAHRAPGIAPKGAPRACCEGAFPVIYVFHKGKLVETYTYDKSPGYRGETLRDLVTGLLKPKDAQGAAKAPAKVGR